MTTHSKMNAETMLWMYSTMVTIRRFEEQSRRESDAGKLRGMHSSVGQEAVPTGICAHLRDDDYVLGTHRSHHHCIAKGVDLSEMMAELLGKAEEAGIEVPSIPEFDSLEGALDAVEAHTETSELAETAAKSQVSAAVAT